MFQVGDRVKCINAEGLPSVCRLSKGKEYLIDSIKECRCGRAHVTVGLFYNWDPMKHKGAVSHCSGCGRMIGSDPGMQPFRVERFVKMHERIRYQSVEVNMEVMEACHN